MRLLDAVDLRTGDGFWTRGYDLPESACGFAVTKRDICGAATDVLTTVPLYNQDVIHKIRPFGIEGMLERVTRCSGPNDKALVARLTESAEELVFGHVLENGAEAAWASPNLAMTEVSTVVAAEATASAKVETALGEYYSRTAETPILHLGLGSAFGLTSDVRKVLEDDLNVSVVVNPAYTVDLVAVTGPMIAYLGTAESLEEYSHGTNAVKNTATKIGAIEFDPCFAVRATT